MDVKARTCANCLNFDYCILCEGQMMCVKCAQDNTGLIRWLRSYIVPFWKRCNGEN